MSVFWEYLLLKVFFFWKTKPKNCFSILCTKLKCSIVFCLLLGWKPKQTRQSRRYSKIHVTCSCQSFKTCDPQRHFSSFRYYLEELNFQISGVCRPTVTFSVVWEWENHWRMLFHFTLLKIYLLSICLHLPFDSWGLNLHCPQLGWLIF